MKTLLLLNTLWILSPAMALAQNLDTSTFDDSFAYASVFASNFSLLLSIVMGVIAAFLVFRAAGKLGGGLFESVLNYIGIGMALVVLGTVATIIDQWFASLWFGLVSITCFALGYIFMVIGANKLLKGIMKT